MASLLSTRVTRTIRLGTRGSALARAQTARIVAALEAEHPDLRVEVVPIATEGDRTQHTNQVTESWGTGVFVKELEQALLSGEIDLAVHSLKDVPPEVPDALAIVAVPPREDPRDALVTLDGRPLDALAPGSRVGTSSSRRTAFLRAGRPDLAFEPLRGNVDTRCRKLAEGQYDAIVLARAGLARLGLEVPHVLLDPAILPPAPGQGALALQARADDDFVSTLAAPLHDSQTAAAVRAERLVMRELDAACRLPLAALGIVDESGSLHLAAAVAAADGSSVLRGAATGSAQDPDEVGMRVADALLEQGAAALLVPSSEEARA